MGKRYHCARTQCGAEQAGDSGLNSDAVHRSVVSAKSDVRPDTLAIDSDFAGPERRVWMEVRVGWGGPLNQTRENFVGRAPAVHHKVLRSHSDITTRPVGMLPTSGLGCERTVSKAVCGLS